MKSISVTKVKGGYIVQVSDGRSAPQPEVCVDLDQVFTTIKSEFEDNEDQKVPF